MASIRLGAGLFAVTVLFGAAGQATAREDLRLGSYPGPPAWVEVTNKTDGVRFLRERIPADQRIETYRDILSAQAFVLPGIEPDAFLKRLFGGVSQSCDGVRVNGPVAGREGGYAVAYAQIYCGQQKGKPFGVNMMFKAIRGDDALYVVQREFRVTASAVGGVQTFSKDEGAAAVASVKAQSKANGYLKDAVYLCGPRATDPRCK